MATIIVIMLVSLFFDVNKSVIIVYCIRTILHVKVGVFKRAKLATQ